MTKDNRKALQLATVLTGVMVPIIMLMAILQLWYLLGVVVVVELALITWTVALVSKTNAKRR